MSAEPSCHSSDVEEIKKNFTGSIQIAQNSPSAARKYQQIIDDEKLRETSISLQPPEFSDKMPLTEYHLCRYEDCRGSNEKSTQTESPLDPFKTRVLYVLIAFLAIWTILYFSLYHFEII